MDLVSIIIPYYKKKSFFKDTINSVKSQRYKNLEIIVIFDDDDPDEFKFIKKNCENDKRIKIIKNNKNQGVPYSRNLGIRISKGKYIAFIDSDDKWKKNKILTQINFMKKNKIKFCFTSYNLISSNGKIYGVINAKNNISYNDLISSCDIGLSTVMLHKSIKKFCIFPQLKTKEDYVVWLRLSKRKIKLFGLKKILTSWRKTNSSLSSSNFQKLMDAFRVYYYYEKVDFVKSIYLVLMLSLNAIKKKYSKIL